MSLCQIENLLNVTSEKVGVCVFSSFFSSINFFTMILMNCMNICHLLEAVKCALANGGSGFLSINTTSALLLVVKLK